MKKVILAVVLATALALSAVVITHADIKAEDCDMVCRAWNEKGICISWELVCR